MRVRFQIDDVSIVGVITPKRESLASMVGLGVTKSDFEIKFEAPIAIAERIHVYIDKLGERHLDKVHRGEEGERTHSYSRYFGSAVYVTSFYDALGINLPGLSEGREPSVAEIIAFVHPQAHAAAAAALDPAPIMARYAACDAAQVELGGVSIRLLETNLALRSLQNQVPPADPAAIAAAIAARALHEAEYAARKAVYDAALAALGGDLPAVVVPPLDANILPLEPAPVMEVDADGLPTGRPGLFLSTQTFRN